MKAHNIPRKSMDADLVELVGDYLANHSSQSYVNVEDMVESIQGRVHRFARMKKITLAAMVKRAYTRYVQMQTAAENERSKDLIEPNGSPVSADSVGDDGEHLDNVSSDSDVEIVESNHPNKTAVEASQGNSCKRVALMPPNGNISISITPVPVESPSPVIPAAVSISTIKATTIAKEDTATNSESPRKRGVKRKLAKTADEDVDEPVAHSAGSKKKSSYAVFKSDVTFKDFAGSANVIEEICQLLLHLKHPEIYRALGITPPRGFILYGPPGCGKSLLASAIAGELNLPTLKLAATELISGISGESENNIRGLFQQALDLAPSIIFIDEIDAITPKREHAQREMERRIVAQLLSCIDDLSSLPKGDSVFLIGATNRIETIDSALRRAGRFDREINIGIPNEESREQILRVICKNLKLEPNFNFKKLAKLTPGYVGADLQALIREAAVHAVKEVFLSNERQQSAADDQESKSDSFANVAVTDSLSSKSATLENLEIFDKSATITSLVKPEELSIISNGTEEKPTAVVPTAAGTSNSEPKDVMDICSPIVISDESSTELYENILTREDVPKIAKSENKCLLKQPSQWIQDTCPVSPSDLEAIFVSMNHFVTALKHVQPSSKREGFATVPDITWDDIGALKEIRDELQVSILGPVKYTEAFNALGIAAAGVLLCGPPGCGKTLLAKAVANEAGINFISVKGPELLNMYVGESERAVRQCFSRAKSSSPCVIFFDELDALCPRRSDGADGNSTSRVVNQLLTEMDGMETREGVYIMAATNRPDIIDPAVLRPGRLDKILFVNLPSPEDRADILKTLTKGGTKPKLDSDVNLSEIAADERCTNFTGADLAALIREASVAVLRELVLSGNVEGLRELDLEVSKRHFNLAFEKVAPSVSIKDLEKYDRMKAKYAQSVKS